MLIDHAMNGGGEFVAAVAANTTARVVVCSSACSEEDVLGALQSGAVGLLRKDTLTTESLASAVRAALDGTGVVTSDVLRELLDGLGPEGPAKPTAARLTDREQQVLALIAAGHPTREVAAAAVLLRAHGEERAPRHRDEAGRPQPLAGRRARGARGAHLSPEPGASPPRRATSVAELIAGKRVVVCAGSGGVGKTTTSAALGMGAAALGAKVAVVTIDPARRLANSLGLAELGNEPRRIDPERFAAHGVEMRGELWALMLDAKRTFDELIEHLAPDRRTLDEVMRNRIYQQLSSAVAGSQEFSAVAKLYELDASGEFDLLVLDTPPSRNALDFLDAPAAPHRLLPGPRAQAVPAPGRARRADRGPRHRRGLRPAAAGHGRRPAWRTCRSSSARWAG